MDSENLQDHRNDADQDRILSELLQKFSAKATTTSPSVASGTGTTASSALPSGDILSSLLSNPELIAKIPTIISSIKPIIDMLGRQMSPSAPVSAQESQPPPASDTLPAVAIAPSGAHKGGDNRAALLCAMKPYLSAERQNAIDHIIKLSRLGDILKSL